MTEPIVLWGIAWESFGAVQLRSSTFFSKEMAEEHALLGEFVVRVEFTPERNVILMSSDGVKI